MSPPPFALGLYQETGAINVAAPFYVRLGFFI